MITDAPGGPPTREKNETRYNKRQVTENYHKKKSSSFTLLIRLGQTNKQHDLHDYIFKAFQTNQNE